MNPSIPLRFMLPILATVAAAQPAHAEHITAYWLIEPDRGSGTLTISSQTPFLVQRLYPVKLARLSEAAIPAGGGSPIAAGTLVYLVVNDAGRTGWCTLKNLGGAAKSLFIPALDKRPCFVDADGDARFESSFSVFDAYVRLSPPQPRGSIDAAGPMTSPARYDLVDPHQYPDAMTLSYRLVGSRSDVTKVRVSVTLQRPGHLESVEVNGVGKGAARVIPALGTVVRPLAIDGDAIRIALVTPHDGYVRGDGDGIVYVDTAPSAIR